HDARHRRGVEVRDVPAWFGTSCKDDRAHNDQSQDDPDGNGHAGMPGQAEEGPESMEWVSVDVRPRGLDHNHLVPEGRRGENEERPTDDRKGYDSTADEVSETAPAVL